MIAEYVVNNTACDQVLFVPSPQSPFKKHDDKLLTFAQRCKLIVQAIGGYQNERLGLCTIENDLSQPAYTANTLRTLEEISENEYRLILGVDNINEIDTFHDTAFLLQHKIYAIPRPGYDLVKFRQAHTNSTNVIELHEAPWTNISSTFVRTQAKIGASINSYLPAGVASKFLDYYL